MLVQQCGMPVRSEDTIQVSLYNFTFSYSAVGLPSAECAFEVEEATLAGYESILPVGCNVDLEGQWLDGHLFAAGYSAREMPNNFRGKFDEPSPDLVLG